MCVHASLSGVEPLLMSLDGHGSNLTLKFAMVMKAAKVTVSCLPPHFTGWLQQCDATKGPIVCVKKGFNGLVAQQLRSSFLAGTGSTISPAQLAALLQMAIDRTCTPSTLVESTKSSWKNPKSLFLYCISLRMTMNLPVTVTGSG